MPTEILTPTQIALLKAIGAENFFKKNFYLTGGTALAGFYLHHRYSEDLDFFSMNEVDTLPIIGDETLKMEFTYFPFLQMEKPGELLGMSVDSVKDIAVNKLFTIYQRTKARDYIDLYCIQKQYGWTIEQLIAWAKIKFDWHIDPIQLAGQFAKSAVAQDYPRMIISIPEKEWQEFFKTEAVKLKPDILE